MKNIRDNIPSMDMRNVFDSKLQMEKNENTKGENEENEN